MIFVIELFVSQSLKLTSLEELSTKLPSKNKTSYNISGCWVQTSFRTMDTGDPFVLVNSVGMYLINLPPPF